MSLKKFDLAKNMGLKVTGQMRAAGVPSRFGQGAGEVLDKRERRARDAALGLVPFACKLPAELVKQLHERAAAHEDGVNGLVAELLSAGLGSAEKPAAKKAAAKKAPAKKAAARPAPTEDGQP
jgi:plasmid stability protein